MSSTPPLRQSTATPLGGIGNNLTVACPCGRIIAAPKLYKAKCSCGRRVQAVGEEALTHLDVWDDHDSKSATASYRVPVEAPLQPKAK